ncbi:hypothetical protein J518_1311 [Acinetobacter baumannii 1419130]|nr:hypothetical protein J518_1311 [Acinetobacter baumannii 1419130]
MPSFVHGGIRHLENSQHLDARRKMVHGGIRHLETVEERGAA